MHITNQSSTSFLNSKTKCNLDGATFTSLKAEGTRLLKHLKHETRAAQSSPSASYKMQASRIGETTPLALVLTDWLMSASGQGMIGYERLQVPRKR